jgi:hypothetical protein
MGNTQAAGVASMPDMDEKMAPASRLSAGIRPTSGTPVEPAKRLSRGVPPVSRTYGRRSKKLTNAGAAMYAVFALSPGTP